MELHHLGLRLQMYIELHSRKRRKKTTRHIYLIQYCVDSNNFEKVGDCESAKQAWEVLEKAYAGADKAKVVRLQTHKRKFELTQMEVKETINDYVTLVIKEWKDFATLSKDELQSSLEVHEQRMDERENDKAKAEIALQARFNEKSESSNSNRYGDQGNTRGGKPRDKSKVQCWKCKKLGHLSNEYGAKQRDSQGDEAKVARQEVDDEDMLLVMITGEFDGSSEVLASSCNSRDSNCSSSENGTNLHWEQNVMISVRDGVQGSDEWYLESGCLTHMTGRKDLFAKINQVAKSRVKFVDDSTLAVEGVGDVLVEKKNDGHFMIKYVFYILVIKCNILSVGQFLENGYKIRLKDKILHVVDASGVLILKALMASNRTFKMELKVLEHRCLATAASR
ncbi:uncharacterized protein LOC131658297 [Vicia villosa]|uniref:uncharacterized protein LOC131658297 n=1 Tax=Vicia villosa TaxID=3911 RepID=UPI00273AB905|nr:uncharacterized protein LOC131658297 [Vicia villosa]